MTKKFNFTTKYNFNEINSKDILLFVILISFSIIIPYFLEPFVQIKFNSFFITYFLNMFFASLPFIVGMIYTPKISGTIGLIYGLTLNIGYVFLYGQNMDINKVFSIIRLINASLSVFIVSVIFLYIFKRKYSYYKILLSFIAGFFVDLGFIMLSFLDGIPISSLQITSRVISLLLISFIYSLIVKILFNYNIIQSKSDDLVKTDSVKNKKMLGYILSLFLPPVAVAIYGGVQAFLLNLGFVVFGILNIQSGFGPIIYIGAIIQSVIAVNYGSKNKS